MSHKFAIRVMLCTALVAFLFPYVLFAQSAANAIPSRITQAVDEANLTVLRGNTHPLAQARFDQGAAPDSLPLQRMLLVLKRSGAQEAALDAFLDAQQSPASPSFHQWLTPQQFGQQFGPSDQDIQTITNWLTSHGFTVAGVSNGRTVIEFSGTAGQLRQAFHTEIHRYTMNGQDHWANASDPQIPAALAPVVAGINTLYNFPRQQMHEVVGNFSRSRDTGKFAPVGQQYTIALGNNEYVAVAPADFAKIYNVPNALNPPAAPATQYNGDGQTIAIVGESDINANDVNAFRTFFGLPTPAKFTQIINGPDPGTNGAETEADLDVQWAGAVAPNAQIDLVLAEPTEVSLGVDLAAQYAVDNNLAPVLNESFGICEFFMGNADNEFYNQLWQQASAEGITVTVSSGDGGSAVCDQNAGTQGPAQYGLTVSGFTSTPYNVSVGGTDFNDTADFGAYWNLQASDTPKVASALGYIPEMTWNDTCTNQEIFSSFGIAAGTNAAEESCNLTAEKNDGLVTVVGGSGGASNCTQLNGLSETSCTTTYTKPSWQAGTGVPADGKRDVPDVSLFASNGFNASFYIICESDVNPQATTCDPFSSESYFLGLGGTSASSPAFGAIMALVNQATGSRQGNANYVLYKLAAQTGNTCSSTGSPLGTCVFYDIPTGSTIVMPCASGYIDNPAQTNSICTPALQVDSVGVLAGYASGAGYDQATGLGSVNAANLISKWTSFNSSLKSSTTTLTLDGGGAVNITHGASIPVSIGVAGSGSTPTGTVSLIANTGTSSTQSFASATLVGGTATFTTDDIPGGASSVFASYSGDATFAASKSSAVTVSVSPEPSTILVAYEVFSANGFQTSPNATTAVFGSNSLLRINVTSQAGDACTSSGVTNGPPPPANLGCPTGSITVIDSVNGGTAAPLDGGTFALNSQGYAEDQSIELTGGTHAITASYPGDSSYNASSSATDTITVTKAPTTITLSAPSQQNPLVGTSVSITATINTQVFSPPALAYPTGTTGSVQFYVGGTPIALGPNTTVTYTPALSSSGYAQLTATLITNTFPAGANSITAQYNGDQNYSASTLSTAQQLNVFIATTIAVSSANLNPLAGTPVMFTAQVTPNQSGGPPLNGSVIIQDSNFVGINQTGPVQPNGQFQASLVLPAGSNVQVNADYEGGSYYVASVSALISENVTAIGTTTSLTSSNLSPQIGSSVTFTATVANVQSGAPAPTGSVFFSVGGTSLGQSTITGGVATLNYSQLPGGSSTVQAAYSPDLYHSTSSGSVSETVSTGTSTTVVISSGLTITAGTSVTFTATITPSPSGGPSPTGMVQFNANGSSIGTGTVSSGVARLATSTLAAGSYQIVAVYSGDTSYSGSSSAAITETVNAQAPGLLISANPSSVVISAPGQSASTTLTFTSQGGLTGSGGLSSSTCGTSSSEEITCTLAAFTLPANGTAQAMLTFSSTAASHSAPNVRTKPVLPALNAPKAVIFALIIVILTAIFAQLSRQRRWKFVFATTLFAVVMAGISCGGGGSSSGGGGGGPANPGTPAGAVQPLSVSITINGTTQTVPNLTLTVQ